MNPWQAKTSTELCAGADKARREWDNAPSGMRAGKILIALSGGCRGYRADTDAIHAVLAKARGAGAE